MKHWIIVSAAVLVGTVLMFRSRVSLQSETPPATTRGVVVRMPVLVDPTTRPATQLVPRVTRGVPIDRLPPGSIAAPATAPTAGAEPSTRPAP